MPTEADLRRACTELAADSPDIEALLTDLPRHEAEATGQTDRTWWRRVAPLAAVVVVLAVVATTLLIVRRSGHPSVHPPPTVPVGPTSAYPCATAHVPEFSGITIDPVPGFNTTLQAAASCSGLRSRYIYTSSGAMAGWVGLYAPGVFDESILRGLQPVVGNGITGYQVDVVMTCQQNYPSSSTDPLPAPSVSAPTPSRSVVGCPTDSGLVWSYAPHSWAVLTADMSSDASRTAYGPRPLSHLLALAAAIHPASQPLLIPFRLTRSTAPLVPVAVSNGLFSPDNSGWGATGGLDLGLPSSGCPGGTACQRTVSILLESSVSSGLGGGLTGERLTINSHPAILRSRTRPTDMLALSMTIDHWSINVIAGSPTAQVSTSDLIKLAASIAVAPSYTDYQSWYSAPAALAH
jgi:hypothetical protein